MYRLTSRKIDTVIILPHLIREYGIVFHLLSVTLCIISFLCRKLECGSLGISNALSVFNTL
jgi:hypothetical protein